MELLGKRVAILIEDRYKSLEVWYPLLRFREGEATVTIVGPKVRTYTSTDGISIQADASAENVRAEDFDALLIPSGSAAEMISECPAMLALIYEAIRQCKVVATIVQARQTIEQAPGDDQGKDRGELAGEKEALQKDEEQYGINRVLRQDNLIQARLPVDLPTFCRKIIGMLTAPSSQTNTFVPHD